MRDKNPVSRVVPLCLILVLLAGPGSGLAKRPQLDRRLSSVDRGLRDRSIAVSLTAADGWQAETVDATGNVGQDTAVAVDLEDHPHISYYDATNGDLRCARFDGTQWVTATVDDGSGETGLDTSIALDAQGRPRISYVRRATLVGSPKPVTYLKLATFDGASWDLQVVDAVGETGGHTSLALTADGVPCISYYDDTEDALKLAHLEGSQWISETVDGFGDKVGTYSSLALDTTGAPHISYVDEANSELKYAHWDSGDWQISTVDGTVTVAGATSLALDSAGRPHITYHDAAGALRYAAGDGDGSWATTVVDNSGDVGDPNALSLDIADQPHVAYYDATYSDLKFASLESGTWIAETVETGGPTGSVGDHCALALDSVDRPVISYHEQGMGDMLIGDLKVAQWDVVPPTIIAGPDVVTTQTSAQITWETDELADSEVRYGAGAGVYDLGEVDAAPVTSHTITLTELAPATLYNYVVRSADPASNSVTSDVGFFETLPPDDTTAPTLAAPSLDRVSGPFQIYRVSTTASDNHNVEKVAFYLDGHLLGTDYAGSSDPVPRYEAFVDPVTMGLAPEDFYADRTVQAVVYDASGLSNGLTSIITPPAEPLNGVLEILSPHPDQTIWVEGDEVPPGTEPVQIRIHAGEYEYGCQWLDDLLGASDFVSLATQAEADPQDLGDLFPTPQVIEPPSCREVERAVDRLVVAIDGAPVYTTTPSSVSVIYDWPIEGLQAGSDHWIHVTATASDGGVASDDRFVAIRQAGIDVQREVTRQGNFYWIALTVTNEGDAPIAIDQIDDNVTSFQAFDRELERYDVEARYELDTQQCRVTLDVHADWPSHDPVPLSPGESLTVGYYAVPIKQVGYAAGQHRIGHFIGDAPVLVRYLDHADRPILDAYELPIDPYISAELDEAFRASDYLLVTNPERLFALYDAEDVNKLLGTMAQLAFEKNGILGYLHAAEGSFADFDATYQGDVDDKIEAWGRFMAGSDGTPEDYLSSGYLLLVGETEIVPAATKQMHGSAKWTDEPQPSIEYTDMYYGNTRGRKSFDPELMVGRIIGDDVDALLEPLETVLYVERDVPMFTFDRSHALLLAGWPKGRNGEGDDIFWLDQVQDIKPKLEALGTTVGEILDERDYTAAYQVVNQFLLQCLDEDIIHLAAHGSTASCGDLGRDDILGRPNPFASAKPLVYASSCLTGRYGDGVSLAEAFLQRGAAVYLGSTEVASGKISKKAAKLFYDRWDPGVSVGAALKSVKDSLGTGYWGYYEDIWSAEYQLYGDPKYGKDVMIGAITQNALETTAAIELGAESTLDVVVPDYVVTLSESEGTLVDIPGGATLLAEGAPLVPVYDVAVPFPAGQRVQDVILLGRSGLTTTSGLDIPFYTYAVAGEVEAIPAAELTAEEPAWWPEDDVWWEIEEHHDGSTTLKIRLYPFYYNAATTDVRFYTDYSFDIDVVTSTVAVRALETAANVVAQGDPVDVELWLENTGAPQDVYVSAIVVEPSSGEFVDSLILESLDGLEGLASFDAVWDSTGVAPGTYAIEVRAEDAAGNALDSEAVRFELGIAAGEVTSFTVTPESFERGQTVDLSMTLSNIGTVPISGTAVIQIQALPTFTTTAVLTRPISGLPAMSNVVFDGVWDTTNADADAYRATAHATYGSTSTDVVAIDLGPKRKIYLPLVLRDRDDQ